METNMMKVKWLHLELPVPLNKLSALLLTEPYNNELGTGFLVQHADDHRLDAQYIEKIENISKEIDPFGIESEQRIVTYYSCRFSIDQESQMICFFDPPRSLRKFIAKLHSKLGIGLVITDIVIDPLKWATHVEENVKSLIITHLASSGIKTSRGGLAKISVASKKDSRLDFTDLLENRKHSMDSIKLKIQVSEDWSAQCEMSSMASCKLKGYGQLELVTLFKSALVKAQLE